MKNKKYVYVLIYTEMYSSVEDKIVGVYSTLKSAKHNSYNFYIKELRSADDDEYTHDSLKVFISRYMKNGTYLEADCRHNSLICGKLCIIKTLLYK